MAAGAASAGTHAAGSAAAQADPAAEAPAGPAAEDGALNPGPALPAVTVATLHMAHNAELDEMIKVWRAANASECLDARRSLHICSRPAAHAVTFWVSATLLWPSKHGDPEP